MATQWYLFSIQLQSVLHSAPVCLALHLFCSKCHARSPAFLRVALDTQSVTLSDSAASTLHQRTYMFMWACHRTWILTDTRHSSGRPVLWLPLWRTTCRPSKPCRSAPLSQELQDGKAHSKGGTLYLSGPKEAAGRWTLPPLHMKSVRQFWGQCVSRGYKPGSCSEANNRMPAAVKMQQRPLLLNSSA